MTAIACFWSFGVDAAPEQRCAQMLRAQQVYAPAREVCWSGGGVALGRRLFPLLPEDRYDRGPQISYSGSSVLVADLRLDNREEISAALDLTSSQTSSMSDAALLLLALERWGEASVERLVGDFAFVHWDADRQRLTMARDFMGQRPLHYTLREGYVAAASMPKGLHALPDIPIVPNRRAAADFLALLPETATESFFEGIEKVQPGHLVTVTREDVLSRKFWKPKLKPISFARPADYEEALREEFDRAVAARLRGVEGHLAAHLSGGLDSSSVVATAARLLGREGSITAFTAIPGENYCREGIAGSIADEGPLAELVAQMHQNIEHVKIKTEGKSPLDALDRSFYLYERPYLNLCNGVWSDAILDEAKKRRLKVLLTGAAGNMSISYSGMELLPQLLRQGRIARLAREAVLLKRRGARTGTIAAQTIGPFLPRWLWKRVLRLWGKELNLSDYSNINLGLIQEVGARAAKRGLDPTYRPRSDSIEARLWVLSRVDLGNYNKGVLGGWGIDVRDPTADQRLVEFCLSVPPEYFLRNGNSRNLARQAFSDRLPQPILTETRKGYQGADWHVGLSGAREQLRQELDFIRNSAAGREALDISAMDELAQNFPETGWNRDQVSQRYRLALLRGVSAGHFLRKASGANR